MAWRGNFGLAITTTDTVATEPFYDSSASFWENYERGPRRLTAGEVLAKRKLEGEIKQLRESGRSTEKVLFGKKVQSPVGLAAGPAPNAVWLRFFSDLGYDLLTHKTVRDRYWKGHPLPNIVNVEGDFGKGFREAESYGGTITNSLGMPSARPEEWQGEVRKVLDSEKGKYVVVSVTATVTDDQGGESVGEQYASLAGRVKKSGAHAVELNLSCPNVLTGEGEVYADSKLCGSIVDAVRQEVGGDYPLFLKSGFLKDYAPLVEETCDGPTAYAVINAIAAEVKGKDGGLPFADRGGKAGVAGAALFEFTRKAVQSLQASRRGGRDFKIVAVGGVVGPERAAELLSEGADFVESATGALNDPFLALRIKKTLLEGGGTKG